MELQGKKVAHDFLSLYPPGSSFQLQDPRSSSQGFYLKTRDFLQPLERGSEAAADGGRFPTTERVFSGACSVASHVGDVGTNPAAGVAVVTTPGSNSAAVRPAFPVVLEAKPEPPDHGSLSTTTSYGSHAGGGGVSYTLWDDKDTACRGQWSSSLSAACGGSGGGCSGTISASAGRNNSAAPEKRPLVEAASSRSNNLDDEDEFFVKREGSSSSRKDLSIKADEQANSDQRPNTPRSKHSATEQRRRSKINDRFQILREVIPHNDQKRDKASFLLEVIEYIRFLQEKVHKYESSYPTWNQDNNAKLMPWRNSQAPANGLIKSDPSPKQVFSKRSEGSSIPVVATAGHSYKAMETPISFPSNLAAAAAAADPHNLIHPRLVGIGKEIADHPQRSSTQILNQDSMAFQDQSPWPRSFLVAGDEHQELMIDDGTISVSTAYSNGLLTALAQTLQRSGVDLSQASIAVQINLGRKANSRRPATAASTSTVMKDPRNPSSIHQAAFGYSRTGNGNEPPQAPPKRRRVGQ